MTHLIPEINKADDAGTAWSALVKAAKQYGLSLDDLKPLLDKNKFSQFIGAAVATPAQPAAPTVSRKSEDVAPVPGAVKLSDGNWYVRNAAGKVVPVPRSR